MARSPVATEAAGEAAAMSRRLGGSFFVAGGLLLAACTAAPPPEAAKPSSPRVIAAVHTGALRLPEAESLAGLGPGDLLARYGEPDLRRPEPPAELWQYRSADCVLEIFLYTESGAARVIGSEIYARSAGDISRCPGRNGAGESRQSRL